MLSSFVSSFQGCINQDKKHVKIHKDKTCNWLHKDSQGYTVSVESSEVESVTALLFLCKPILYPESLVEKRIGKIKTVQDRKIWKEIMKSDTGHNL